VRKLWKRGSSLQVTIPKKICDHLALQDGDYVQVRLDSDSTIQIRKVSLTWKLLDDLSQRLSLLRSSVKEEQKQPEREKFEFKPILPLKSLDRGSGISVGRGFPRPQDPATK